MSYTDKTIISKWHKIVSSNNRFYKLKFINHDYVIKKPGWCRPEHIIVYNYVRNKPLSNGFNLTPLKRGKQYDSRAGSLKYVQALKTLCSMQTFYSWKCTMCKDLLWDFMQPFWYIGLTTDEMVYLIDKMCPKRELDKYISSLDKRR